MSLNVQQLLNDARRLSSRLRDHEEEADTVITTAQAVLKEVEALREYQEDLEELNEVANNRPRAQLVLGIQQENRHIRQLQHENKELRAALEESQSALELIMSKYRQHVNFLVHTTKIDKNLLNNHKTKVLQQKTDQISEMVGIMQKSIQLDDESSARDRELQTRLLTENKGLRELLEIARKNGSLKNPLLGPKRVSQECQTDFPPATSNSSSTSSSSGVSVSSSTSATASNALGNHLESQTHCNNNNNTFSTKNGHVNSSSTSASSTNTTASCSSVIHTDANGILGNNLTDSEDSSEDEEIIFNTIKRSSTIRAANKSNGRAQDNGNDETVEDNSKVTSVTNGDNDFSKKSSAVSAASAESEKAKSHHVDLATSENG